MTDHPAIQAERETLTPREVAKLFRVDPKTVARWVKVGQLERGCYIVTPGGHRRYFADEMLRRAFGEPK